MIYEDACITMDTIGPILHCLWSVWDAPVFEGQWSLITTSFLVFTKYSGFSPDHSDLFEPRREVSDQLSRTAE